MSSRIIGLVALPGEAASQLAARMRPLLQAATGSAAGDEAPRLLVPAAGPVEAAAWALLSPQPVHLCPVRAGLVDPGSGAPAPPADVLHDPLLPNPRTMRLAYQRECTAIAHCVAHQGLAGLAPLAGPPERLQPAKEPVDLSQHDLTGDPLARPFNSRPVQVRVEFAARAGTLATLEGDVQYRAGAALLTGLHGERWPVERPVFNRRYRPDGPHAPGSAGPYRKAVVQVAARQLMAPFRTRGGAEHDVLNGRPWDWLVQYAPGEHGVVAEALFGELYEPVPAG